LPATRAQQFPAVTDEHAAVGALPARIGRREVDADIAQRKCAKHRVAQRVQDCVAVAVREYTAVMRHAHAADHHVVAFPEGVYVIPLSDTDVHGFSNSAMRWMSTCSTTWSPAAATPGWLNRPSPASSPTRTKARWNAISALPARRARPACSAQSTVSRRTSITPMRLLASSRCVSLTLAIPAR